MSFPEYDDLFDLHLKEQLHKKQKKLDKQERLNRKKMLIEEIKNSMDNVQTIPNKGTREWALHVLNSKGQMHFGEIKKNYLQLVQKYHPDKNEGKDIQEIRDLNEAWEFIKKTF